MRLLIIKRLHKAKNIVKDQAERLEKPSVDLFKKECKETYRRERLEQNKWPFSKGPSFSKQKGEGGGGERNIYKKFHYQRRSVSHRYKSRRFPGKKIQQKGNFLQQKHSSAKRKHSNTPNGAKPISKHKSQQFSSSRRAAIFSKTL